MKEIQQLYDDAAQFRARRNALAQNLKNVDVQHVERNAILDREHTATVNALEAEKVAALSSYDSRARKEMSSYIEMKRSLQSFAEPIAQWCNEEEIRIYQPNPARVNEDELNKLVQMVQEQGVLAWLKRTFRIGGYSSRAEMAFELCMKIEDACAFCDEKISEAEMRCRTAKQEQTTQTRRKIQAENEKYTNLKTGLDQRRKLERDNALEAIRKFENSSELRNMRNSIERMYIEGENACGAWGEFIAPTKMPEELLLCNVYIDLPDNNGIDRRELLPLWVNLFESNIIVVTANNGQAAGTDCKEKQFVRKLIARMLKTIPPEFCSYSIFDSLHKGGSLERLIDITNVGTTDLNFDLFTSNENDGKNVSCADRRKYLRSRPAEIIKFTAGRSKSLFDYNREAGDFEFPFSWIIDFNFSESPDSHMMEDMKELFVNANAAGYSFVFVTSPKGYDTISSLAEKYTDTQVLHVDCDTMTCSQGSLSFPMSEVSAPNSEQIYNFMTALKKYYDEGDSIDNRIGAVFSKYGIKQRDSSKKLTIPMAIDSRGRLVDLELGGEGSVHGFISGGTNSGKSTLLHTIILSACLYYHPDDLEIWLVDYKQTEFYLYKKNTPPHIKLIGVSKTADFTFSLLDRIEAEASRRTNLMNLFDAQNLEEYRKHAGESGYENITRLLLIIDEFHEMSQFVSTEIAYKDKLENILREYRAQGITCLMADQAFSTGLSGLTSAAKNQIGLRIAMRNEASPQEIKDTLEVDRALYSDSMQQTIAIMSQGEFIMKVYVRNTRGQLTDVKLEKFKGLNTKGEDISPISKALRSKYKGQFNKQDLIYVNTKEQVAWDDGEPAALDRVEPLRYPNIRLYLGRSATLQPCFALDMGRQPDENLSIVGGTALQRWELLASIMQSCRYRNYKMIVFMAEYSDLMSDFASDIRQLCSSIPGAELLETTEEWCQKLSEIDTSLTERKIIEDTICIFIGLEIANIDFSRLPDRNGLGAMGNNSRLSMIARYAAQANDTESEASSYPPAPLREYNVTPIIDKLFSVGARNGIRCITEVSVYRQFSKILKIKDMCRHKIAFSMGADDCLMYLGNSNYQKSIGRFAIYSDGGKEVKKLLPYRI